LAGQIEKGLNGLCQAGLILPQPAKGGRRFAFRHPLIQEVAYTTQLKVRRGVVHSAVAVAMEAYYSEQLDEYAGLISYHFEAAGKFFEAALYASRAARWVGSTDSAQAIKHWRKVRVLLLDQPRSPQVDGLRALAGGRIVYLGWREGLGLEEVQRIIDESLALASEADNRLIQLLLFARGRMLQSSGGPADGYVDSLLKALALSPLEGDEGRVAALNLALSHAYAWTGQLHEGLAANDVALRSLSKIDRFDREFIGFSVEQWVIGIRSRLLVRMGRFEEAEACLQQMPSAEASVDPVMSQISHHVFVDLAWCKNDAALAQERSRKVADIAAEHPVPYSKVFALTSTALAQLTAHEFGPAKRSFTDALAQMHATGVAVDFEAELLAGLAECHLHLGERGEALAAATEAERTARQRSNRFAECRALIVWGAALAAERDGDSIAESKALLERAEILVRQTGARILEAPLAFARSGGVKFAMQV
jgi:adenylate cyclase